MPSASSASLRRADVVAAVRVGLEGVDALAGPLDGPAELPGGPGQDRLFRVVRDLRAEAAAHVGRHDPQLVLGKAEDEGAEEEAGQVGVLAGCVEGVLAGRGVVVGDRRARLDRVGDQAVVDHVDRDDMGRVLEGGVGGGAIADLPVVADVAGRFVEDQGRAVRLGGLDRGHRREVPVVHVDQVGRFLRLLPRLSHHDRHAVTHIPDLAQRERRMGGFDHGRPVLAVDQPPRRDAAHALHVLAGEDRVDAGRRHGRAGVDPADVGVRDGRAEDVAVQLPGQVDVVRVAPAPRQEAGVFLPLDRGADSGAVAAHDPPPMAWAPAWTALTMLWYPVQRQRLPSSHSRTSCSPGSGFRLARSTALITIPGVQNPHWSP